MSTYSYNNNQNNEESNLSTTEHMNPPLSSSERHRRRVSWIDEQYTSVNEARSNGGCYNFQQSRANEVISQALHEQHFNDNLHGALYYHFRALDQMISTRCNCSYCARMRGVTMTDIGNVYEKLSDYQTALKCYDEAMNIFNELHLCHGQLCVYSAQRNMLRVNRRCPQI